MIEFKKPCGLAECIDGKICNDTIWTALSDEEIELFNRNVSCRLFTAGETIFMEGDYCKGLYFVESGLIAVRKYDQDGQPYLIRLASQGDTLGYRPFLAKETHRAGADVIEDTKVCFINAQTVRKVLSVNGELSRLFLERTAKALGEADEWLFNMAVLDVDIRLIHLLLMYHDQWGSHFEDGSVTIRIPITRGDLAAMIGAHPDSVSRAIRKLESEGLMQADGRIIHIEKFDHLAQQIQPNLTHLH